MESLGEGSWSLAELHVEPLGGAQLDPDGVVHGVPGGVHLDPGVAVCGVLGGVQPEPAGAVHGVLGEAQLEPDETVQGVPGGDGAIFSRGPRPALGPQVHRPHHPRTSDDSEPIGHP